METRTAAIVAKDSKSLGYNVTELHDTVLIAAAFCMFNRYVDGLATWARKTGTFTSTGHPSAPLKATCKPTCHTKLFQNLI